MNGLSTKERRFVGCRRGGVGVGEGAGEDGFGGGGRASARGKS